MQTFTEVRLFPVREFRIFYLCVRNSSIINWVLTVLIYIDGHKETKAKLDGHAYKRVIEKRVLLLCVFYKSVFI